MRLYRILTLFVVFFLSSVYNMSFASYDAGKLSKTETKQTIETKIVIRKNIHRKHYHYHYHKHHRYYHSHPYKHHHGHPRIIWIG